MGFFFTWAETGLTVEMTLLPNPDSKEVAVAEISPRNVIKLLACIELEEEEQVVMSKEAAMSRSMGKDKWIVENLICDDWD